MIKVIFFAALREQLACSTIELAAQGINNVVELKKALIEQHPSWQPHFENTSLLYAVNKTVVDEQHSVSANDEVAFFPPVTGG